MCCYGNTKQSIRYATQLIVMEEVDMLKEVQYVRRMCRFFEIKTRFVLFSL